MLDIKTSELCNKKALLTSSSTSLSVFKNEEHRQEKIKRIRKQTDQIYMYKLVWYAYNRIKLFDTKKKKKKS